MVDLYGKLAGTIYTSHMDPINLAKKHLGTGRTKRNLFEVIQLLTQRTMPPVGGYLSLDIQTPPKKVWMDPKKHTNQTPNSPQEVWLDVYITCLKGHLY